MDQKVNDFRYEDKNILITGGTGSLGQALTPLLLSKNVKKIKIYSRDEYKQYVMKKKFDNDKLEFYIGDIRDKDRLIKACNNIDCIIHAASIKHVPSCENNPMEAIKTNIFGSQNVIDAAKYNLVNRIIGVSTDKAVNPINFYGHTKAIMEKLFINANKESFTKFSCVRYGNVVGSRGSVIPFFKKMAKEGKKFPLTDKNMTRFWITLGQAANFVLDSLEKMQGQEIFIPKLPVMKIIDLAKSIKEDAEFGEIGIRQGEKVHETLIGFEESNNVIKYDDFYKIYYGEYPISWENKRQFTYASNTTENILSIEEMRKLL